MGFNVAKCHIFTFTKKWKLRDSGAQYTLHQHKPWKESSKQSERGKKARLTQEEVGRQYQEMDRPGVRQVPEGSGEQRKMEETGCEIICDAPTTLAVKG